MFVCVWVGVGVGGDVNNLISLPDPPFVQVTQYIRERLYLVQIQMPSVHCLVCVSSGCLVCMLSDG